MQDEDAPAPQSNWLPAAILAALVLLLLGGWWIFPKVWNYMSQQDCIAAGHTNCAPPSAAAGG